MHTHAVLHENPVPNVALVGARPALLPGNAHLLLLTVLMINKPFDRIREVGARSPPKESLSRSSRFILSVVIDGKCDLVQQILCHLP